MVEDFEFDGVDICFEPHASGKTKCERGPDGQIKCNTDTLYRQIVATVREKLPTNKILSVATWSTGAYGEGQRISHCCRISHYHKIYYKRLNPH